MSSVLQALSSAVLGVFSVAAIGGNWVIVFRCIRDPEYRSSLIPLVGGAAGCLSLALFPIEHGVPIWLPFMIDWGSGLGVLTAPFLYLRYRYAQRGRRK